MDMKEKIEQNIKRHYEETDGSKSMVRAIRELRSIERNIESTKNDLQVMVEQLRFDVNKMSAQQIATFVPNQIEAIKRANDKLDRFNDMRQMIMWITDKE